MVKIRKENFGLIAQINKNLRVEYYKSCIGELSAPLSVSVEVTSLCPLNCEFCYSSKRNGEMSIEEITGILKDIESAGVFEIHIGGGEPLLREDLFDILYECKGKFITSVTTSGYGLGFREAIEFAKSVDQVNINFHSPFAETAIKSLISAGVTPGVNLITERKKLPNLRREINRLKKLGIKNLYLLGPKPVKKNLLWYKENKLHPQDMITLKRIIEEFSEELRIYVDCSLIGLMSEMPSEMKTFFGLFGCQAGIRKLFISSDGKVYPCSFLTEEEDVLGNLACENFKEICLKNPFSKGFNKIFNPPLCISRYESVKDNSSSITGRMSLKLGISSEHSAVDYFFYSIEKLSPEKMEEIKKVVEKHLLEMDNFGEGEKVSVYEHGVDHYSWILPGLHFMEMLADNYFEIVTAHYELSLMAEACISFPWDEELYKILNNYSGVGKDGRISVIKGKNRIILKFSYYALPSYIHGEEIATNLFIPIREGILKKMDFTPLQAFVDFYEVECPNSGKKEEYSKIARRFRRTFRKEPESDLTSSVEEK
jgi:MoaA/NifB/PqqE/SkfB family radical SAM enzyme